MKDDSICMDAITFTSISNAIFWDILEKGDAKKHIYGHENHGNLKGKAIVYNIVEKESSSMEFPMKKDVFDMQPQQTKMT